MNRSQCLLNKNSRKSLRKSVRAGRRAPASAIDMLPPGRPTQAVKDKEQKRFSAIKKSIGVKAGKLHAKRSKRTTTGIEQDESPPKHIHVEGERWIKTLQKQSSMNSRRLMSQLAKASPKRGFQRKSKGR